MDFTVDGVAAGSGDGTVRAAGGRVEARVTVAARLDEQPHAGIASTPADEKPYWDLERARIAGTREVPVEFVVNGRVVETRRIVADGTPRELRAALPLAESAWVAVRILPSSHTNPVFVEVSGKPMRPLKASARWALEAVDKCWKQKVGNIRDDERAAAAAAYDHARAVYRRLLDEGLE
jgi:hypothetical protein